MTEPGSWTLKTEAVVAKLRHLADKLESGQWRLVRDATVFQPGRPERYVIEYDTHQSVVMPWR